MKLKILKCERLEGSINISGSKNTTLPILAASMLSKKTVVLKNIPLITGSQNKKRKSQSNN